MALEEISLPASSHLQNAHYDIDSMTLYITFRQHTYAYMNVPGDVAYGLGSALSAGNYFNDFIKGQYEYRRLQPGDDSA